jgi:hypothetical protein
LKVRAFEELRGVIWGVMAANAVLQCITKSCSFEP